MLSLTYRIFKNDTNNLFTKQKQIHRLQKQPYGYQSGNVCWGGISYERGINIYMILCIK